ncbi:RDD family protein [Streptomyces sp. NPDC053560]|uniref:RDD family protein n=1 Tax=Streptomyces sp. NPDC053560 TaxID=3365711 RepID=UPI0037D5B9F7
MGRSAGKRRALSVTAHTLSSIEDPHGKQIGKKALNIRAVRDGHGQTLGVGLALARRMLQFLNYAVFGLGWWWAIWDAKSQTFADKLTNVVSSRPRPLPPLTSPAPAPGSTPLSEHGLQQPSPPRPAMTWGRELAGLSVMVRETT